MGGGGLKHPFGLKEQCYAFSMYVTQTGRIHKGGKTAVRRSLVPHAVLLMPFKAMKCTLVV